MMIWRIFQNLHHFGAKKSSKKWRKTPCGKILLLGPMMLDSWHLRFKLHQGNRSTFDFPQERHPFDAEKKKRKNWRLNLDSTWSFGGVDIWMFFHLVQGVEGVNFQPLPAIDGVFFERLLLYWSPKTPEITLPTTGIVIAKWWLEDYFPFWKGLFSGPVLVSGR